MDFEADDFPAGFFGAGSFIELESALRSFPVSPGQRFLFGFTDRPDLLELQRQRNAARKDRYYRKKATSQEWRAEQSERAKERYRKLVATPEGRERFRALQRAARARRRRQTKSPEGEGGTRGSPA